MVKYLVPIWISTTYFYTVEAETVEDAVQKIKDDGFEIDYEALKLDADWDFGDVGLSDVHEIKGNQ